MRPCVLSPPSSPGERVDSRATAGSCCAGASLKGGGGPINPPVGTTWRIIPGLVSR